MKPRQAPTSTIGDLTEWDAWIWGRVEARFHRPVSDVLLTNVSIQQDRRDADLMFQAHKPRGSRWCLGCIAGPFCCDQGKPWQCRLRVLGSLRDIT